MCGRLNGQSGKAKTPFIGFQDLAQSFPGCVAEKFPHQTSLHLAPLHDQLIRIKMPLNMTLSDMRDKCEIVNSIISLYVTTITRQLKVPLNITLGDMRDNYELVNSLSPHSLLHCCAHWDGPLSPFFLFQISIFSLSFSFSSFGWIVAGKFFHSHLAPNGFQYWSRIIIKCFHQNLEI